MSNLPLFLFIVALILGVLGYTLEIIFDFKLSRKILVVLLGFFILFSVGQFIYSNFDFRTLEKEFEAIRDYGEVATWTFLGYKSVGGMMTNSPVSGWRKDYVKQKDGIVNWECTSEAINHYKQMIVKHPRYPFPLYPLVICLKKQGNDSWRQYARKAVSILEKTTQVPGHNPGHDDTLLNFKKLLNE